MPTYLIFNFIGASIEGERVNSQLFGLYAISYRYSTRKWFSLGIDVAFEGAKVRKYGADDQLNSTNMLYTYSIMPAMRFTYLNRPIVRLYSGLQVGCYVVTSTASDPQVLFGGNVTLFGVSVGKRLFGYVEMNLGMKGIVQIGLGYRVSRGN